MFNGIRVIPPPYGADTPWFGAKIIGNVSYVLPEINIQIWFT